MRALFTIPALGALAGVLLLGARLWPTGPVPLAGMLATARVLRELGWERSFGDLGGDLDLGWRAQLAGHRVVVAPDARLRSVAALGQATATTPARRRAARRVALGM